MKSSGLNVAYLKLSEEELLEEDSKHNGYVDVIGQLTIDESNRLRREVQALKVEKNSWKDLRRDVDALTKLLKPG